MMLFAMKDAYGQFPTTVSMIDCPRCLQNHVDLPMKEFDNAVVEQSGVSWTHWAECPQSGDPILISITDVTQ